MFLLNIEEMERSEITLVKIIHYRQLYKDFLISFICFYNATTQNKREIDRALHIK